MMTPAVSTEELARLQPLAALGVESLRHLQPLCRRERCARGLDPLLRQDASGQIVYLLRGELKIDIPGGGTQVLVGGTEQAAAPFARTGQMPTATKAITDVELLRLNEESLDIMVTWDQVVMQDPMQTLTLAGTDWRMMSGMFSARSLTHGAFTALPPAHIDVLLQRFEHWPVKCGDIVVREGEAGDFYYLIERGRCKVTRVVAGDELTVAELQAGDAFGEEALVSGSVRNASVSMLTDGILLRLAKGDFIELLREPLLQQCPWKEAVDQVAAGARWLDVRFPAEFREDGLPGAVNMPLNELRRAQDGMDKNCEYIAYCQSGRRSSAAAFILSQRGFRVRVLEGGLHAVETAGQRVENT